METNASEDLKSTVQEVISEKRTLFIVLGILLIVLGIVAIVFPIMTTFVFKTFIGWLMLIGGVVQIYHSFSGKKWSEFFLNLLIGVAYAVVGAWLAFFPLAGIIGLTVLLAFTFIFQGILEASMSMRLRPLGGWGWMMFSGLISAAVGIMLFAKLPSTALWAIGLLVGVNMITSGWSYLVLALAARKVSEALD